MKPKHSHQPPAKWYEYDGYSHRFDRHGNYQGFFDSFGSPFGFEAPFDTWSRWDVQKHQTLINLGFTYRELRTRLHRQ